MSSDHTGMVAEYTNLNKKLFEPLKFEIFKRIVLRRINVLVFKKRPSLSKL